MNLKNKLKLIIKRKFPKFFVNSRSTSISWVRFLSGTFRILPDFIIIGAQKSGTTSLYDYIIQHPLIISAITKQPHYFDINYDKNLIWYRAHFPTIFRKLFKKKMLTGEASTDYMNHPLVPKRIKKIIPNAKIIIILRNPISRTYSQFKMNEKLKIENKSFFEAIENDYKKFNSEIELVERNEQKYNDYFKRFDYLGRGLYFSLIQKWLKFFPENQILIIKLEDLDREPQNQLNKIFTFLDIPKFVVKDLKKRNVGNYNSVPENITKYLETFFKEENKKLMDVHGINYLN